MYNRYISGAWPEDSRSVPPDSGEAPTAGAASDTAAAAQEPAPPLPFDPVEAEPERPPEEKPRGLSALKGLLGSSLKLPEFNADTILLLVLVYFLVADDSENINDTLLIIGILLLLGF